ncbi:hypothetical protein GCM10023350_22680 [Nocardioides endophyticus]|uniref:Uncharacterized protein n=1 Tax=Nocardioides endophyticus TaxID=1353775 RepID=A0ABP8YU95_9ACTN
MCSRDEPVPEMWGLVHLDSWGEFRRSGASELAGQAQVLSVLASRLRLAPSRAGCAGRVRLSRAGQSVAADEHCVLPWRVDSDPLDDAAGDHALGVSDTLPMQSSVKWST